MEAVQLELNDERFNFLSDLMPKQIYTAFKAVTALVKTLPFYEAVVQTQVEKKKRVSYHSQLIQSLPTLSHTLAIVLIHHTHTHTHTLTLTLTRMLILTLT